MMGYRNKPFWTVLFSRRRGSQLRGRLAFAATVLILAAGYWTLGRTPAESGGRPIPFTPERVITTTDGPVTISYGPSQLTIDTGSSVVIPGSGAFFEREVFLTRGRVTARVRHLMRTEEFNVRTPTAVAGVRGTVFSVALVKGGERTLISVLEGSVLVRSNVGETTLLAAGRRAYVEADEPPILYERFTDDEIRELILSSPTAPAVIPELVFHDATISDRPPVLPEPAINPHAMDRQSHAPNRLDRGLEPTRIDPTQVNPSNPQPVNPTPKSYQ